jgi:hypothetical protein
VSAIAGYLFQLLGGGMCRQLRFKVESERKNKYSGNAEAGRQTRPAKAAIIRGVVKEGR